MMVIMWVSRCLVAGALFAIPALGMERDARAQESTEHAGRGEFRSGNDTPRVMTTTF
jgi:hypothetical protein